jgi:hypothetical protein
MAAVTLPPHIAEELCVVGDICTPSKHQPQKKAGKSSPHPDTVAWDGCTRSAANIDKRDNG